jgi:hypothetical protein
MCVVVMVLVMVAIVWLELRSGCQARYSTVQYYTVQVDSPLFLARYYSVCSQTPSNPLNQSISCSLSARSISRSTPPNFSTSCISGSQW